WLELEDSGLLPLNAEQRGAGEHRSRGHTPAECEEHRRHEHRGHDPPVPSAPPPRTRRPRPASAERAPSSSPGGPARSPTTDGGPTRVGSAKSAPADPRGHQPVREALDRSYSLRHAEGAFEEIEEP